MYCPGPCCDRTHAFVLLQPKRRRSRAMHDAQEPLIVRNALEIRLELMGPETLRLTLKAGSHCPASHALPNRDFWETVQPRVFRKYLIILVPQEGFEPPTPS